MSRPNLLSPALDASDSGTVFSTNGAISAPLTAQDVEVQALSRTQWRVRDRRLPQVDARGLLGFVEKVEKADTTFELMALSHGFEWFTFPSLREAVAHLVDRSCDASTSPPAGDLAWIA